MKSHLSTKSLKKLKQSLPPGSMNEIAVALGINQSTVSRALNGIFKNKKVIDKAIEIARRAKEDNERIEKRIEDVLS